MEGEGLTGGGGGVGAEVLGREFSEGEGVHAFYHALRFRSGGGSFATFGLVGGSWWGEGEWALRVGHRWAEVGEV